MPIKKYGKKDKTNSINRTAKTEKVVVSSLRVTITFLGLKPTNPVSSKTREVAIWKIKGKIIGKKYLEEK